jgi:hypothetical protein
MCATQIEERERANHEVRTVTESSWSGLKNGELLALAEVEFDVFLTLDQNLIFQQNLQRFNIGIILMVARNNRFKTLLPLMPEVNAAMEEVKPGELARIGES